jgi:hypothetical protein
LHGILVALPAGYPANLILSAINLERTLYRLQGIQFGC